MNRVFYHRIDLIIAESENSGAIWEVQKLLAGIAADVGQDHWINGKKPRFVVEPPPWKQPLLRAGGKMLSALAMEGIRFEVTKTEWNYPLSIYYTGGPNANRRPELMCTYNAKVDKWACMDGVLSSISNFLNGDKLVHTYNNL